MKICFLVGSVATPGGIQRVTSLIANEFAKDNEVTLVTTDSPIQIKNSFNYLKQDIRIVKLPDNIGSLNLKRLIKLINVKTDLLNNRYLWPILKYNYANKKLQNWLIELCQKKQFGLVIAVNVDFAIILGSIASKISARTIGWQHNSTEALFFMKNNNFWHQDYLARKYLPKLDQYVVLTSQDQLQADKLFDLNSVLIPNPVSFLTKKKASMANKTILAAGRFVYAKGFDFLLDSFKEFSLKYPDWQLIILGDGPLRKQLIEQIDILNLGERVRLPGMVEDIQSYYLQSSFFVLSSRWEGLPMVVLEAQESGLPIISFDIQAVKDLIVDGQNGFLVPFEQKSQGLAIQMEKLASDFELRTRMSQSAIKQIENYKIAKIMDKWQAVLGSSSKG